ncbi:hypothetical protein ACJX0J_020835, partial [Zea mays]
SELKIFSEKLQLVYVLGNNIFIGEVSTTRIPDLVLLLVNKTKRFGAVILTQEGTTLNLKHLY